MVVSNALVTFSADGLVQKSNTKIMIIVLKCNELSISPNSPQGRYQRNLLVLLSWDYCDQKILNLSKLLYGIMLIFFFTYYYYQLRNIFFYNIMLQLLHKVKFIFQNVNNYFGDFIMNTKELVTKIIYKSINPESRFFT